MIRKEGVEVVDKSENLHNQITHRFLREYAKKIGPSGFLLFNGLLYFANKQTKDTWVSYTALSELLGIDKKTIERKLRILEEQRPKILKVDRIVGRTHFITILRK